MPAVAKEKDFQRVTNEYARRCIASMRDELDALAHARECDGADENGKPCKRGTETETYTMQGKRYKRAVHDCPEAWHDEETARRKIEESPLSLEVRSGWHAPGEQGEAEEYNILLGTGGPASRIIGELNEGSIITARFQYQDWFKPWTDAQLLTDAEEATLLEWAQQFYFES